MIASPSALQFRRLAQSSPWRWTTVEFEFVPARHTSPVHAWIRRPGSLRVETSAGKIVESICAEAPFAGTMTVYSNGDGPQPSARWPSNTSPVLDEEGLVSELPSATDSWLVDWDDPFYENYQWTAMLNPIELTRSAHDRSSTVMSTEISGVTVVEHGGRRAWEATVRTTEDYGARCECCPLLSGHFDFEVDHWVPGPPVTVRLDVQTGICVYVGPTTDDPAEDTDIDVTILAVDETMGDSLFLRSGRQ
ncbi:hypothetical protein ACIGGF_19915 [Rhodococcus sp. NPDC078407]|uniref:hypothetical protein n=1 Tax=Rhodococcus sp. NPDC078407 TaxID=3364509 RepID=UPI0037C652BF